MIGTKKKLFTISFEFEGYPEDFIRNIIKIDLEKCDKYQLVGPTRPNYIEKEMKYETLQKINSILFWNNEAANCEEIPDIDEFCFNDSYWEVVEMIQEVYDNA